MKQICKVRFVVFKNGGTLTWLAFRRVAAIQGTELFAIVFAEPVQFGDVKRSLLDDEGFSFVFCEFLRLIMGDRAIVVRIAIMLFAFLVHVEDVVRVCKNVPSQYKVEIACFFL